MEVLRDELIGSDHSHIMVKGKRTKRQRSLSPFVATTSSSTGRAISDDHNSTVSSSPATDLAADCTKEEEDMAICLIMLAHGTGPKTSHNFHKTGRLKPHLQEKINDSGSFYVYECKTCSRTFPSFQALGGHRASHKKPRISVEKTKLPLPSLKLIPSEAGHSCQTTKSPPGPTLAYPESNNNKTNKVHECSICGSEFMSGQALGGHMRRHRTVTTMAGPGNAEETGYMDRRIEPRKYLALDLNLPAPEDDMRESKFQGLVFTATPSLIDCHY